MRLYCPFQGARNRTASNIVKKKEKKKNIPAVSDHAETSRLKHRGWKILQAEYSTVLQMANNCVVCVCLIEASCCQLLPIYE